MLSEYQIQLIEKAIKKTSRDIAMGSYAAFAPPGMGKGDFVKFVESGGFDKFNPETARAVLHSLIEKNQESLFGIIPPVGFELIAGIDSIIFKGPYDAVLQTRLKRAGGYWNCDSTVWEFPVSKIESLSRIFKNADKAKAKEKSAAEQRQKYFEDKKELERAARKEAAIKLEKERNAAYQQHQDEKYAQRARQKEVERLVVQNEVDVEKSQGIERYSAFFSPCQQSPIVGQVFIKGGQNFKVIAVAEKILSKSDIDREEDMGQPGLDYGTRRVLMKLKKTDENPMAIENIPLNAVESEFNRGIGTGYQAEE